MENFIEKKNTVDLVEAFELWREFVEKYGYSIYFDFLENTYTKKEPLPGYEKKRKNHYDLDHLYFSGEPSESGTKITVFYDGVIICTGLTKVVDRFAAIEWVLTWLEEDDDDDEFSQSKINVSREIIR